MHPDNMYPSADPELAEAMRHQYEPRAFLDADLAGLADDLPGTVSFRIPFAYTGFDTPPSLLIEQELAGPSKYGAWLPVTDEVLGDAAVLRAAVDRTMDRHLRPWRYPDRPRWPSFDPFPRITHLRHQASVARTRLSAALAALRGEASEDLW